MRSFRLPTRIDGCLQMRGNITDVFNTTTATSTIFQTVLKFVEEFKREKLNVLKL
jgi:hypothetical protein